MELRLTSPNKKSAYEYYDQLEIDLADEDTTNKIQVLSDSS